MISSLIQQHYVERNNTVDPPHENVKYYAINYHGATTKKFQKIYKNYDKNISLGFKNACKFYTKLFTKTKQPIDKLDLCNLVYLINCRDCDSLYIGETSQKLKKRLSQHMLDIRNCNKKTALAEHAYSTGHTFDFDNCRILHLGIANTYKRKMIEKLYIQKYNKNAINFVTDIEGLEGYKHLI